MDAIRVAKVFVKVTITSAQDLSHQSQVEGVLCSKAGITLPGSLHLTAHHLIFRYDEQDREEMWVSSVSLRERSFTDGGTGAISAHIPRNAYAYDAVWQLPSHNSLSYFRDDDSIIWIGERCPGCI